MRCCLCDFGYLELKPPGGNRIPLALRARAHAYLKTPHETRITIKLDQYRRNRSVT